MTDPIYEKSVSAPQWEYRQPTWDMFLTIREWAQEVANIEGYPIYLVGSALWKSYPRDIDLSMILPVADFEARYGVIPEAEKNGMRERLKAYCATGKFTHDSAPYVTTILSRIHYAQRVDFKIQPDTWFADRDKLLLAEPHGKVAVRYWLLYGEELRRNLEVLSK